jgi:hypothetical protein
LNRKRAKTYSKPLGTEDASAVEFVQEMLQGDPTYGINFDRVQWDSEEERYVIVEFLLCEERQFKRGVTPYSSHPNRYFNLNAQKFISLWKLAQELEAKLYLVNYSKSGTKYQDQVLLMEVLNVDKGRTLPVETRDTRFTRKEFSEWFRALNSRGS